MTREEAITILKGLMENPLFNEVYKVVFNIAIHDIKQRHEWDINNLILINKENYEPQTFKWCTDCREYDQEKHCCHRWSKVIRDTVEEIKLEQEPFINKPCVSDGVCEHDKQMVLEKMRAEIAEIHLIGYATVDGKREIASRAVMQIIDKYKAESEG